MKKKSMKTVIAVLSTSAIILGGMCLATIGFAAEPEDAAALNSGPAEKTTKYVCEDYVAPTIYDVPLGRGFQEFIRDTAEPKGVDPVLVIAVIGQESNYDGDIIGDNGSSFGLMQIQPKWHAERMERLGCEDLLNDWQNVEVGVDILAELLDKNHGTEWALMAYNGGEPYADAMAARGEVSEYAETVLMLVEDLRGDAFL